MAVVARWFGKAILGQWSSTDDRRVDWAGDTIKVALLKSSYTPDQDEHDFFNDVSAHELAEEGEYETGGLELANRSLSYDGASNTTRFKADDAEWTAATFTARYAVIYKDTGGAGTSPLMGWIDFGENKSVTSGLFKIEWDEIEGALRGFVGA